MKSSAQISFDSFQVRRPVSLCDASLFLNVQQLDIQTVSTHVGARHLQMEGLTHVAGKRGRRAQRTLNGFLSPAIAFSLKPHSFFPLLSARPSFMSARESLTELIGACAEIFWFQANWAPPSCQTPQIGPQIFQALVFSGLLKPTFEEGNRKSFVQFATERKLEN